jgi:hypothetical protein
MEAGSTVGHAASSSGSNGCVREPLENGFNDAGIAVRATRKIQPDFSGMTQLEKCGIYKSNVALFGHAPHSADDIGADPGPRISKQIGYVLFHPRQSFIPRIQTHALNQPFKQWQ